MKNFVRIMPLGLGRRWARPIFTAILLLFALGFFRKEIGFLFEEDPRVVAEVTERFNDGFVEHPGALENRGFVPGPKGWHLPPRSAGTLRYTAPVAVGPGGAASLFLVFYRPPQGENAVKVSWDGGKTFALITIDVTLLGSRIELAPPPKVGRPQLLFEATNDTPSPILVLDRLDLRIFERRPTPPPTPLRMALAFVGLGLPLILLAPNLKRSLLLLGIVAVGFLPRYLNLLRALYAPLDPDAQLYRALIERMTLFGENGFYSANFSIREPFFLLVAKAFSLVFGPSDTHLRLFTLFLSLFLILLVYQFIEGLLGFRLGLVGALIMALNLPFVVESGRGLRLELETALILLLATGAFLGKPRGTWRWPLLGLLGGLILLTRWSHLPLVIVLILLSSWTPKGGWKRTLQGLSVALALALLLVFPQRYAMYAKYGDPFFDVSVQARGFANLEFAGTPGFPSLEEVRRNVFAGPPLSSREYLFTLHSPSEVLLGIGRGIGKITFRMDQIGYRSQAEALLPVDVGWIDPLLKALGILGLAVALVRPACRWLPLAFLISLLPIAFLYDLGLLEPYRLTMHAFPFFLAAGLLPFHLVALALGRWGWRIRGPLGLKGKGNR